MYNSFCALCLRTKSSEGIFFVFVAVTNHNQYMLLNALMQAINCRIVKQVGYDKAQALVSAVLSSTKQLVKRQQFQVEIATHKNTNK